MNSISREEFAKVLTAARVSRRLQKELRFVPEEIGDWAERDFLAVTNRSRNEGVLLLPFGSKRLVSFRLLPRSANSSGRLEAILCDICATWQRGTTSAIISFQKEKGSVSFLCCADLLCSLHVRGKTSAAVLSRTQLREDITDTARVDRLRERLLTMTTGLGS